MSMSKKTTHAILATSKGSPTHSKAPSHDDRSISPFLIPVHQDLIPGSRGEGALANHLYWIQRIAKEESMKLK